MMIECNFHGAGHFRITGVLILSFLMMLFNSCGTLRPLPPRELLSDERASGILKEMEVQESRVGSFYAIGTISARQWYGESEAGILIAGRKAPFRLKIEMTHSWGKPILHILIDQERLEVLSFNEERHYSGPFTPGTLSKFIPGELDAGLAWGVLRGYPQLLKHHRYASLKPGQIALFDQAGRKLEEIDVGPEGWRPVRVFFPDKKIQLFFSDFQENGDIAYAGVVRVEQIEPKQNLILRKKKVVFNKDIPDQIFRLEKPPGFDTYSFEENDKIHAPVNK
ncbi:MAG: hypothetical protein ABII06_16855 [Pseudomonadota bacterium]